MPSASEMTFWDHLEVLRRVFLRILAVAVTAAIVTFIFKDFLFTIVLAPGKSDFVTYRAIEKAAGLLGCDVSGLTDFNVSMFSAQLTAQFMIHLKMAFCFGILVTFPYIIYQLYGFVAPALRSTERRYTVAVLTWSYVLFMAGVLLDYFLIFPLAFRFLGTYQVSPDVPNMITLTSYGDMLLTLTLMMGVLFELPILSWFLARLGLINEAFMRKYRRHAVVVIFAFAAIVTPTTDVFTLMVVALPVYGLYEVSIGIVRRATRHANDN